MAAAATVSIIMMLVLALVIAGLITGLVLWLTAGKPRRDGEMACGGCGYSVRGLEQLSCPECGADLRTVGIHSGGSQARRTWGVVLTSVCGLVLLTCCGFGAFSFLFTARSSSSSMPSAPTHVAPPVQSQLQEHSGEDRSEDAATEEQPESDAGGSDGGS